MTTSGAGVDRRVEVVADAVTGHAPSRTGSRVGGRDEGNLGAERREQPHVRSRDPGVQDVADDRRRVTPSSPRPREPAPCSRRRIVNASSSAWVGCSCVPSPALTTPASIQPLPASTRGAPDAGWRMTTPSAPIAARVCAVSLRLSPFETLEPFALKLMTSAREPLGGGLEGDAGAGRVLEEQVHDGLAAQRRELLDLAARDIRHVLGDVEDARSPRRGLRSRVVSRCLMPRSSPRLVAVDLRQVHVDALARSRSAGSCRRSPRGSAARGGRGRRARRAARRAGGRGRSRRRGRRGWCDRSRARRRRARRSCRRCRRGDVGGRRRARGVVREVVAVHRHVEGADRRRSRARCASRIAAMRRASTTPRVGMPRITRSCGAAIGLEDLVGDPSQRSGDVSLLQHGARSHPDLLPRLTGRT